MKKILLMLVFLTSFINAADYDIEKLQYRNDLYYVVNS